MEKENILTFSLEHKLKEKEKENLRRDGEENGRVRTRNVRIKKRKRRKQNVDARYVSNIFALVQDLVVETEK